MFPSPTAAQILAAAEAINQMPDAIWLMLIRGLEAVEEDGLIIDHHPETDPSIARESRDCTFLAVQLREQIEAMARG